MTPSALLFDSYGTVADTHPGIEAAVALMLGDLGLPPIAPTVVATLTGKGVPALVRGALRAAGSTADEPHVLALYRDRYTATCTVGVTAYPGIVELVGTSACPRALLTNKPRAFTERIVSALGLERAFSVVVAGDDEGARLKPDPWAIHEALRRLGVAEAARAVVVGDTLNDVLSARAAGVPCVVAGWGHGGAEVRSAGCPVASSPSELSRLLQSLP